MLNNLGCDTKEDVLDLEYGDFEDLDMRLLEKKRWDEGYENVRFVVDVDLRYVYVLNICIKRDERWYWLRFHGYFCGS